MNPQVIVIGGGIGGLAAAVRLARAGMEVTLLEKAERVGGLLSLWEAPHPRRPDDRPFRFDTGPNVLTTPFVVMDLFEAAGEDVRQHLNITKLDPSARFIWPDGTTFDLSSGDFALHQQIERLAPTDQPGWTRLLARGRRCWEQSESWLTHAPEQLTHQRGSMLRMLTLPFRNGALRSFGRAIDGRIGNRYLRDALRQYALFAGADPARAPATLLALPWIEHYFGVWHTEGGMYRLAERLEAIARKLGVTIRTNCEVARILLQAQTGSAGHKSAAVVAVKLQDGKVLRADAVLANCDVEYTRTKLVGLKSRAATSRQADPAGWRVLMLGIDGTYPQLAHRTILMDDHPIYLCCPTRTDPSLAPEGCDVLLIQAPASAAATDISSAGAQLVQQLEQRFGLADLGCRIVVERMLTHSGWRHALAAMSLRSTLLSRLAPHRDGQVRRLYYCGASTHPGGGVAMAAISAKIAAELIAEDLQPRGVTPAALPWVHGT